MPDPTPRVRPSESTRIELFSDAVMAIVLTLLVLELRVPPHEPGQLPAAIGQMGASVVAFLISFLRVSVIWVNHHDLFGRVRRVDHRLLWMNLWLLLNCTIIPIPTTILADALRRGDPADLRAATVTYVLLASVVVAAWLPIFRHLRDHLELVEPGTDAAFFDAQRTRLWAGVIIDAIAVGVAMIAPIPALGLWTLSLIFIAATSDGVRRVPRLWRRGAPALRRERARAGR
jgi:uncharacterized membrane protein